MISATIKFDIARLNKRVQVKKDEILEKIGEKGKIIAEEATELMKNYIQTHAKHPTGELASLLNATYTRRGDTIYLTLANKTRLNQEAPYWYVLNYGEYKRGGKFIPISNYGKWVSGKWIHIDKADALDDKGRMKRGVRYLKPKRFTAINYLTVGIQYAMNKLSRLSELVRKK